MTMLALPLGVGFVLALVLTAVARIVARKVGLVAIPKADRWHRTEIPMLGGAGIALALLLGTIAFRVESIAVWILLGGALVLAAVGLYDDSKPLRPQTKLVWQIGVAAALAASGLQLHLTGFAALDLVVTIVWFVGITNAFNLLDNMDGLAAGIAAITVGFRVGFLVADGNVAEAEFAAIVLGTLLGFLVFNFNPASIFMGDTGSLFVGTIAGGLSLIGGWPYSRSFVSVLLLPVLLLLVPIFDTTLVTVARIFAGRRVSVGGRDHSSHRLVALGLSEREAVLVLYAVAIVSGIVASYSYRYGLSSGVAFVALLLVGLAILGVYLGHLRVYPEGSAPPETARVVSLIADFSYKRQVATVVVDFVLIVVAYYAAYLLRFEGDVAKEQNVLIASLPVVIVCQMSALALFRVYQGIWRYTSLRDLLTLAQAVSVGTTAAVLVVLALYRFSGYSRAVFVIDWLLLVGLISMCRLSFRALAELLAPAPADAEPVLVYGAGDGGAMVLRELRNNRDLRWRVAAFLDDDRTKVRTTVQGVPVLGGIDRLDEALATYQPARVVISTAKLPLETQRLITERCGARGVAVVTASLRFE